MNKILVIDDDYAINELIKVNLELCGYKVIQAHDGTTGFALCKQEMPSLVILDVMMPEVDGFTVAQRIRKNDDAKDIPILMLTALSQTSDKVKGLDLGADDYLAKPFSTGELLARIRALLRRKTDTIVTNEKSFGDLTLNVSNFEMTCGDKKIKVSLKESEIMQYFLSRPNFVVTKDELIIKLWGYDSDVEYNNIEVYISFLRKKLAFLSSKVVISTVRGVGYKLEG